MIFKDKKILITGGTGSIGSELVKRILKEKPTVIRIISNDENSTFEMQRVIKVGDNRARVRFFIGDVRDKERLILSMEDIDIVYHTAALKHVPLCEYNPFEAIKTNVLGTQNVIEAAFINNVEKVINISTDKAVNPINTMGATKLLAEKLITDANEYKGDKRTIFSNIRFGNVMLSRGSVIPIFDRQIKEGGPITITDSRMTRFMMTLDDAINLILEATELSKGGETYVLKMQLYKIIDIAKTMIGERDIEIKEIGIRSGEKLHEELLTRYEIENACENDKLIIINPKEIPEGFRKVITS